MRTADIVVGLGFGDEGKGITTDFLASQNPGSLVVRFSGGQNAGHTVQIDGKRHIFSNFGSGTMRGCPTYWSKYCCFYPVTMMRELELLKEYKPKLYIDPAAILTTPYDVAWNRVTSRQNSVGLGIGATMQRHNAGYKLFAIDLLHQDLLEAKLNKIEGYYLTRLAGLGVKDRILFHTVVHEEMKEFFIDLMSFPKVLSMYNPTEDFSHFIFEGSQGILLDMDHGIFPDVTYSNTTSKNAHSMCKEFGLVATTWYVTRCYQTRHGKGWMSSAEDIGIAPDLTNQENEWQGAMHIGEFDAGLVKQALAIDLSMYNPSAERINLVMTHLDLRPDFKDTSLLAPFFDKVYGSYSPESKDFKLLSEA